MTKKQVAPRQKEILQHKTENDELSQLSLKMTAQLQEMEKQTQALMNKNEALKKAKEVIVTVIPIVGTAMPSNFAEHLAPQEKLVTAVSMSSKDVYAADSSNTQV